MVSQRRLLVLVAVAAFLVALLGTRYIQAHGFRPASASATTSVPAPPIAAPAPSASSVEAAIDAATEVVVDVSGAVRRPGVVHLLGRPRIVDALRAAGGPTRRADLGSVNLAALVADGAQIIVGVRGAKSSSIGPASRTGAASAAGATSSGATTTAAPVSLSSAGTDALESLPGVGPAIARKIIDYREVNGPFRSVDDLVDVPGIGPAKLEALRSAVVP